MALARTDSALVTDAQTTQDLQSEAQTREWRHQLLGIATSTDLVRPILFKSQTLLVLPGIDTLSM